MFKKQTMDNLKLRGKVILPSHTFLFLPLESLYFLNSNFGLKVHFLNILILELERRVRKSFEKGYERESHQFLHFSVMKPVVFSVNMFYSTRRIRWWWFFSSINMLGKGDRVLFWFFLINWFLFLVFITCFWVKIGWKINFQPKSPRQSSGQILGWIVVVGDASIISSFSFSFSCFEKKEANDMLKREQ